MDVSKFIKDNKITIIAIIVLLIFVYIYMKKERFTSWDTNFSCDLGNIEQNGVTSDAEPIKTTYVEGKDILTTYYKENAFNVDGFTENL